MRIYVASFFDTRARLRPHADTLWHRGYEVVSSWLNEITKPSHMTTEEFWRKLARKDLAEIQSADLVIVDTLDVTPRGGREVEMGYALARHQATSVWLVGPVRNVFHELADRRFENWVQVLKALPAINGKPKMSPKP